MEWNWLSGNNMTPFLLSESIGDSEEGKLDVQHNHEEEKVDMDEQGVAFRFNDEDEVVVDDEDDAQSCSYDHSSYINTRYDASKHDQSQRLIYNDDDHDDGDIINNDDEDEHDNENQYQTKVMDSSKQQWRSKKSCVHDPSNQREMDRKFWETCLAS